MFELDITKIPVFVSYGITHLWPIIFFTILTFGLIYYTKDKSEILRFKIGIGICISLMCSLILWSIYRASHQVFDLKVDLPLHLCNILPFILIYAFIYKKRSLFGILYFFILAGTLQSIITPDLKEDFPHYIYFRYWLVHCGLVMLIFYTLFVLKWKVYLSDIKNAFYAANIYLVFSVIVNLITGGNYFFSMAKPEAKTMLDYLGPWPWYLLSGQIVMMMLFFILYLPIHYWNKKAT